MASLRPPVRVLALGLAAVLMLQGCTARTAAPEPLPAVRDTVASTPSPPVTGPPLPEEPATSSPPASAPPTEQPSVLTRPAWLGTRTLPLRADGFGEIQPTPPELRDRRLPPEEVLPPPPGVDFAARIEAVPPAVADRSTWSPDCPVALDDLRYVTLTFWGFDERAHTGELLIHASAAEDVAAAFRRLYDARFPIEQMRVVARSELDAPPTGDGNNTTAFVCRPTTGGTSWSQHAHGLAVDVNPFHNPYAKGDLVVPELASAYLDRDWLRPGMIIVGDPVTQAFAAIGWHWGGNWRSSRDFMHFSATGR